jgi:hypothetical protein
VFLNKVRFDKLNVFNRHGNVSVVVEWYNALAPLLSKQRSPTHPVRNVVLEAKSVEVPQNAQNNLVALRCVHKRDVRIQVVWRVPLVFYVARGSTHASVREQQHCHNATCYCKQNDWS